MDEILAVLKLYSTQVILAVASLNTIIGSIDGVPWWVVLAVNVCGVVAHHIARRVPQPEVAALINAARAKRY